MKEHQTNTEIELKRYSDGELEEFKKIIEKKLIKAYQTLPVLEEQKMNPNGTEDTSPIFKCLQEGSNCLSKERTLQDIERQEKFIRDLKLALIRIENKTYGVCRVTGNLISKGRLRAVPHATLSVEAKEAALPLNGKK